MEQTSGIPRPEYPRPQFVRKDWLNLNGVWEFEIDRAASGKARRLFEAKGLEKRILVPFCPESRLSGIHDTDFMAAVWYRRAFSIPPEWKGRRVLLHFGAVDYDTTVWVNGIEAGRHRGGYTSFCFDITPHLKDGENILTVCAEDDTRSGLQPTGKQCERYASYGCLYTRTTGIWQTVWLECVSESHIESAKYIPDPENGCLYIEAGVKNGGGCVLTAAASFGSKPAGKASAVVAGGRAFIKLDLSQIHLWGPGQPNLYGLTLTLTRGDETADRVESYFGLRSVSLTKKAIAINGKPVFQRLVLDQGFYPDGIYTAPSDEALKRDIELALAMGFNGARLHQKVFEPRFLYWADRMGYLVWGEFPNWGLDITGPAGLERILPEWLEAVTRDFNSPAIVGWCPFNETWDRDGVKQDNEVLRIVYLMTKYIDKTRPVIDTSGAYHVQTDVYDIHLYEQDAEKFAAAFEPMKYGGEVFDNFPSRQHYGGQPYFVSEYGGIWWNPGQTDKDSWGYGNRPKTPEEYLRRYEALTHTLLDNPSICAFCYTQLYDIELEVNGLHTYDRKPKFDPEIIRRINTKQAAIERQAP